MKARRAAGPTPAEVALAKIAAGGYRRSAVASASDKLRERAHARHLSLGEWRASCLQAVTRG